MENGGEVVRGFVVDDCESDKRKFVANTYCRLMAVSVDVLQDSEGIVGVCRILCNAYIYIV